MFSRGLNLMNGMFMNGLIFKSVIMRLVVMCYCRSVHTPVSDLSSCLCLIWIMANVWKRRYAAAAPHRAPSKGSLQGADHISHDTLHPKMPEQKKIRHGFGFCDRHGFCASEVRGSEFGCFKNILKTFCFVVSFHLNMKCRRVDPESRRFHHCSCEMFRIMFRSWHQ